MRLPLLLPFLAIFAFSACGPTDPDVPDAGGVDAGEEIPATCEDGEFNGTETGPDCGGPCAPCEDGLGCAVAADCASGVCTGGTCAAPSCTDGVKNGSELATDCGAAAGCDACPDGTTNCTSTSDCQSGVCTDGTCAVPSCSDGVTNGDESDQDCGGSCSGCSQGEQCNGGSDCTSGVCTAEGTCAAATCQDGVKNGSETDVDCGNLCGPCVTGSVCAAGTDCLSGVCDNGLCVDATCSDGVKNGDESDIDCGGGDCAVCDLGQTCTTHADCASFACPAGVCTVPACTDNVKNGNETDTDCGGPDCPACGTGLVCAQNSDCIDFICDGANTCAAPLCTDNVGNGQETGLDCGGPACPACPNGEPCAVPADCQTGICLANVCSAPSCFDSITNQDETDVDCGGSICGKCGFGLSCNVNGDCQSDLCLNGICTQPTCNDGIQNQNESDVDCGGVCPDCTDGKGCNTGDDCTSGVCTGNVCQAPACGDGVRQLPEQCDDGNTTNGDGCDEFCNYEGLVPVLLIPLSSDDSIGMYDPTTGAYLGDFVPPGQGGGIFTGTIINAVQAPNLEIWVTDQSSPSNIYRFQNDGTYLGIAGNNSATGRTNVRGLEFYNGEIYLASSSPTPAGIFRFDMTLAPQGTFASGSGPWDIYFLNDGRAIASIDEKLRLFPAAGGAPIDLRSVSFPQQVTVTPAGTFLIAGWSSNAIYEVNDQATTLTTVTVTSPRGIAVLDNGNWLTTASSGSPNGVVVIDPVTQTKTQVRAGTGFRMIESALVSPALIPPAP